MASGTLQLSAVDLRTLTKWPDAVIEDYLNTVRTVGDIVQTINVVVEEVALIGANPSAANIAQLYQVQADLAQVSAAISSAGQQAGAQIQALMQRVADAEQQLSSFVLAVGLLESAASKNAALVQDLVQLTASNVSMIGQLGSTIQVALSRIENLEQLTG